MTLNIPLTIALSKGRIFDETMPLLRDAGLDVTATDDPETSRRLILGSNQADVRFIIVRASDVPTYVQHHGADIGVAGKDVLLEHDGAGLYEPLDLQIARCRLSVCGPVGSDLATTRRLRVATKFVNSTRRFFAGRRQQVEIIKLYGSMELAPLVGMADLIVDVVDTGKTLHDNGLTELETIAPISSRLVVNRTSMKTRHQQINRLISDLSSAVQTRFNP